MRAMRELYVASKLKWIRERVLTDQLAILVIIDDLRVPVWDGEDGWCLSSHAFRALSTRGISQSPLADRTRT